MVITIESNDFIKPKFENVIIIDISKEKEENKLSIVQGHFNKFFGIPVKKEHGNHEEYERELHFEEWPDLSKDSQLKNVMSDSTSSIDYSVRVNVGTEQNPDFEYKLNRLIINDDKNVNVNMINPIFKKPKNTKEVLLLNKEIADNKYKATCYPLNAKKHYKKFNQFK